ncbi:BPI fold-containing family B member 2 [Ornithorhynchus anatinus]|uniref:BPI fold-containing family B member 2 n=1 Tax=Ornithorhynchus anatinus TaxID=9258 RepID=UPI0019D4E144|nr:BPI fold-containing family B member 2 [Ornithorhynchus anatinus]
MAEIYILGLFLGLLILPQSDTTPASVVRINQKALDYVCEVGKAPLQKQLQLLTVPEFPRGKIPESDPIRVHLRAVQVPHLSLKLVPDVGLRLSVSSLFHLRADSLEPEELKALLEHIRRAFNNQLCLSISNLVLELNVRMSTLAALTPVGPESQILYSLMDAPIVTRDYLDLEIKATLFLLGKPIVLPAGSPHFSLPPDAGSPRFMLSLGISQDVLDSAFLLLQKAGSLNLDIVGQVESDHNELTTSALGELIPEISRQIPESLPVVLKARLREVPVPTLRGEALTLQLHFAIYFQAPSSSSISQTLFTLDADVLLGLRLSVNKVKLQASPILDRTPDVTLAPRELCANSGPPEILGASGSPGILEVTLARQEFCDSILGLGLTLPNLVGVDYVHPEFSIHEGQVVISCGLAVHQ